MVRMYCYSEECRCMRTYINLGKGYVCIRCRKPPIGEIVVSYGTRKKRA